MKDKDINNIEETQSENIKKPKSKAMKILDVLVPVVCLVVALCAGYYLYSVNHEYDVAVDEYKGLELVAGIEEYPETMDVETEDVDYEETKDPYHVTFRNLNIDFDTLAEINKDIIGWLYMPALQLSYPIVQGEDNDYYLKHTYEGVKNSSGSIFIDAENKSDFSEPNTFVYGHNMKNDSMFGTLKELIYHQEWIDLNPEVYIYTKNHAFKYKIFACYQTTTSGFTYFLSENEEQLQNYLEKVQMVNLYENGKNIDMKDKNQIITLSTCAGANTNQRTIVHAYLFDEYLY